MHNKLYAGAVCYVFFPKFEKSGGGGIFPPGSPAGYGPEGESFVLTRTQYRKTFLFSNLRAKASRPDEEFLKDSTHPFKLIKNCAIFILSTAKVYSYL